MRIDAHSLSKSSAYKLLTGVVVPRPIAWVSTVSPMGVTNIAPFSCFTFVSADPPMLGFNAGLRDGQRKDTTRNIVAGGGAMVHIVDEALLHPMHRSAADYGPDESEIELLGLETVPGELVEAPRLVAAPIAMECVFERAVSFGRSGAEFVVCEVKRFHIADHLLAGDRVDTSLLRPVARLAGPVYSTLGEIIRFERSEIS
ncbi:flavin reductase family protein [Rhodovarius crocodyli]|uniref:Flavin reductase family protein n=1 Tax=Rhodovarius crocodyli TaxID=1979269 RepID=A0A437MGI0_9PROT|nr:flavin reductase family protein [Rhodovarius crocodyli]RVT96760.1 flavin reductase family protein [Rhodovarius crocodyli]